jgi:hypothetical protein
VVLGSTTGPEQLPPPEPAADEIRRGAEEILARPEFQEPPRSLYQQAMDKLGELLGDAIDAILGGASGTVLAWIVVVVVTALLVFLVTRGLQADRRRRHADGPQAVDVDLDERRPATAWEAEAARQEAQGNWREALRCRYRALVAKLAANGVVEEVPGRTAGEYRTLVRGRRPTVAEPFAGATDLFERAWYGRQPTGPDEARDFEQLAGRVLT